MLKKQTIWLLTMLSLMIVLSVFYMTSDKEDLAYIDDGTEETDQMAQTDAQDNGDVEVDDMESLGEDDLFTTIRMSLEDERSMKKDRLNDVVASSSATTEEKNDALDDINMLDEVTTKESILEESILAQAEYQDVLVRSDEEIIHVYVKVDELSDKEANNIMKMVQDEFGDVRVDVNFQPSEQ